MGYGLSLLIGPLMLAFQLGQCPPAPAVQRAFSDADSVALFTLMNGLYIIVSRKKPYAGAGYLVLENGIYAFGMAVAYHQPLLIELGILLDVFVGVFVMGIAIFHISAAVRPY